jgi:hypothetical protein
MALTRVKPTTVCWQWWLHTGAIERLIRRLLGRQVAVTGLGGTVVAIVAGNYYTCVVLVSGVGKEEGKRGCWL